MSEFEEEESPKSRTGRFSLPHRGNTRVEVGEPVHVGGQKPWLCAVKLLGKDELEGQDIDPDATQTLLVRTGRGATPEEAQRDAVAQLTLVFGTPVGPPPEPRISQIDIQIPEPPPPRAPSPSPPPSESRITTRSKALGNANVNQGATRANAVGEKANPEPSNVVARWLHRLFGRKTP